MVLEKTHKITLYNDDKHSFAEVQACLIEFCRHDPIQAAQCATIVSNNGKHDVKSGSFDEMFDIITSLADAGLDVKLNMNEGSLH